MKPDRIARALAASVVLLACGAACAAEPSVAAWAGPYAGVYAGYGWGTADSTAPFDPGPGFFYNFGGAPYSFSADGFFGGAAAGRNWHYRSVVTGIEGEIGTLRLRGERVDPNGIATGFPDTTTSVKSDWYGALTARVGVPAGNALFYAKGGGALLRAKVETVDPCVAPPAGCGTETLAMSGSQTLLGWTLGAGVEWPIAPRWTLKAEVAYFDFGHVDAAGRSSTGTAYFQTVDIRARAARIGLNYRF